MASRTLGVQLISDRPLFKTRNARWRTLQVILMNVTGQFSGNGLGYFNTVVYGKMGITSVVEQLQYNLVYAVVCAIGAFIGACFSDRLPRRWPLVYGTLGEFVHLSRSLADDSLLGVVVHHGRTPGGDRQASQIKHIRYRGRKSSPVILLSFRIHVHVFLHAIANRRPG